MKIVKKPGDGEHGLVQEPLRLELYLGIIFKTRTAYNFT